MSELAVETAAQRLAGRQVSRTRAATAAVVTGFAAAVLTYRLLRRPTDESPN